ncbi:unnamed protein product, partial [Rodentolepis nana]|uniref:HECT domain-containing protein n=1 Tax=Rodentolepis nana TaxID=102285 RepID=A0A0R3TY90_RODNA
SYYFTILVKQRKSILSPLFDSNVARKFSWSPNLICQTYLRYFLFFPHIQKVMFRNRSSDVNQEAPLLLRLKHLEATELKQVIWHVRSGTTSKNGRSKSYNGSEQSFLLNGSDTASVISSSGYSSINSMNLYSPASNNCCFRTCLTVVLHAAVECTCDSDRFIRHQAVQTLSKVTQVIGLFDHTLLANIIMTHMSFEPTLLTYGCLEILLSILVSLKSGNIGNISINLANTEQAIQLSPSLLSALLSIERSRIWLRTCSHYIDSRETFDAVTLNAIQVVMCALTSVHQLIPLSSRLSQRQWQMINFYFTNNGSNLFSYLQLETLAERDEDADDAQNENDDERDYDQCLEDNAKTSFAPGGDNQLDIDIESLILAVDSIESLIQRLLSLHNSRHKEYDCFGWIPESPTRRRRSANGVIYTATNEETSLEFTYLILRRVEMPLQVYLGCNSRRGLSRVPNHLQPMNVETVAVVLSKLIDSLASLGFKMYMTQFISRRRESISGLTAPVYIEALREKCMISIINLIGLITESLPKSPVLGVDTKIDFDDSRRQTQSAIYRLESYVNSSARVKETCDNFINIIHDIINFARRNLYPKSFMKCSHWWWIGHMCSSLPNLCQTAPGQVDTSRLVELLCNEISTLRMNTTSSRDTVMNGLRDGRNQYLTLPSMPRSPPVSSSSASSTSSEEPKPAQLNWMRVKHVSMAMGSLQNASRRPYKHQKLSLKVERVKNSGSHSDAEVSSGGKSDNESQVESTSSGCESDEAKSMKSEPRSGSNSNDRSLLKKQDFQPLSIEETSILVAKLIKCSDARTIEPLQNIIPRDIVSRVRKMIQEEQKT